MRLWHATTCWFWKCKKRLQWPPRQRTEVVSTSTFGCNSVFLHVESIFKIKEIRDEYLFQHWNSMNALLTFHNIQWNFWPSQPTIRSFFLHMSGEYRFSLGNRKQIVYSSSIIITFFFTRAVNTAFPCTTTHTHTPRTVYEQTSSLTIGFFLDISGFKTVIPWKACNSCNRNSSIPCLSEAKFWKKTYEKMIILSLSKNIGGAHPSHPLCSLRHRFKNAWDLKFKEK